MSERIMIDVMVKGKMTCPRIIDFEKASPVGAARITDLETIEIEFDYPLSHSVKRIFTNQGGFNAYDIFKAVHDGYTTIYREEEAATGDPGHVPGMLNRQRSAGPHGIWGHDIGDLYLEGIVHDGNGRVSLLIGS